ncbi:MAG: ClpXP protease specificity-enhancing factor SspB [Alphaproteobacteria bacterium]
MDNLKIRQALYKIVQDILNEVAQNGLQGEDYFVLQFQTPKATLPDFVRAKYPFEITIVLQHQFQDLVLTANAIEVVLTFGGVASQIVIPYETLKIFANPASGLTLTFPDFKEKEEKPKQTAEVIDLFARKK